MASQQGDSDAVGYVANKHHFKDRQQRRMSLLRFINFYNIVKPHKYFDCKTPMKNYMATFMIINCKQRSGFLHSRIAAYRGQSDIMCSKNKLNGYK